MKRLHIGLDFGTYQTKVCVFDVDDQTHEFFRFPDNGFFLPSRVATRSDGRMEYGALRSGLVDREYFYFKMAAVEDDEFRIETFEDSVQSWAIKYKPQFFDSHPPELLSVLYLCYVLFLIKRKYQSKRTKEQTQGLLGRLFRQSDAPEEVHFTVRLGIPTEWSHQKNLIRKRKFENILFMAHQLQLSFDSIDDFLNAQSTTLLERARSLNDSCKSISKDIFESKLNETGLSVYAETAAGLTFLVKSGQLKNGYYATLDIGAGTTDVSFFSIQSSDKIKYLASESYLVAANNVYKEFGGEELSIAEIHGLEQELKGQFASGNWKRIDKLVSALDSVNAAISKLVKKLFNTRVYFFHRGKMAQAYSNQPIIVYGGGSRLPKIGEEGVVKIFDSGSWSPIVSEYYLERKPIDDYRPRVDILPANGDWRRDFPLLVVALGLSYILPADSAQWFEDKDYHT